MPDATHFDAEAQALEAKLRAKAKGRYGWLTREEDGTWAAEVSFMRVNGLRRTWFVGPTPSDALRKALAAVEAAIEARKGGRA